MSYLSKGDLVAIRVQAQSPEEFPSARDTIINLLNEIDRLNALLLDMRAEQDRRGIMEHFQNQAKGDV